MRQLQFHFVITALLAALLAATGCKVIRQSSKYNFNDGVYQTSQFRTDKVYVLKVGDDTISVFPVVEYKDSTYILTKKRVNYMASQRRIKDNKMVHNFYKPSLDVDVMTIPVKYRFASNELPNTLTSNFSGAIFAGYRVDNYKLDYRRTPLNTYKQTVKHLGYSLGLFCGVGSTVIDNTFLTNHNYPYEYQGTLLLTGIAANMGIDNITMGLEIGPDYLLDQYRHEWIYEGKPCIGFTLGLDLK